MEVSEKGYASLAFRGGAELSRRGMARHAGHETRFNAAELDSWLNSGKLALPKDEGE